MAASIVHSDALSFGMVYCYMAHMAVHCAFCALVAFIVHHCSLMLQYIDSTPVYCKMVSRRFSIPCQNSIRVHSS